MCFLCLKYRADCAAYLDTSQAGLDQNKDKGKWVKVSSFATKSEFSTHLPLSISCKMCVFFVPKIQSGLRCVFRHLISRFPTRYSSNLVGQSFEFCFKIGIFDPLAFID